MTIQVPRNDIILYFPLILYRYNDTFFLILHDCMSVKVHLFIVSHVSRIVKYWQIGEF